MAHFWLRVLLRYSHVRTHYNISSQPAVPAAGFAMMLHFNELLQVFCIGELINRKIVDEFFPLVLALNRINRSTKSKPIIVFIISGIADIIPELVLELAILKCMLKPETGKK